jgi:tRNA threonylcarbamoyladenosine dehydratase
LQSLQSLPQPSQPNTTSPAVPDLDDVIVSEQLSRNLQFFGRDAMEKIVGSFVVVVGLGGVGSHAAHLLLRSGVGRLLLVGFDQVRSALLCED